MRITCLNSDRLVSININKYRIDWDNDGESKLEIAFRDLIYSFWKTQIILFQFRIPSSLLRIDFLNCNKRLAIEIDGDQHERFNPFFHNNSRNNYLKSIKRDLQKEGWCEKNNITLLRLNQEDLLNFSPKYIEKQFGINIL